MTLCGAGNSSSKEVISDHIKTRKVKVKSNNPPLMTVRWYKKKRYRLFPKAKLLGNDPLLWRAYRQMRNMYSPHTSKAEYWKNNHEFQNNRNKSFFYIDSNQYLPREVVDAPSIQTFKKRLDQAWGDHPFTFWSTIYVNQKLVEIMETLAWIGLRIVSKGKKTKVWLQGSSQINGQSVLHLQRRLVADLFKLQTYFPSKHSEQSCWKIHLLNIKWPFQNSQPYFTSSDGVSANNTQLRTSCSMWRDGLKPWNNNKVVAVLLVDFN